MKQKAKFQTIKQSNNDILNYPMIIYQKPNKSLLISIVSLAIAFFTTNIAKYIALFVFVVSFTTWSLQEILTGVNRFRKLLGILGILFLILFIYYYWITYINNLPG